MAATRGHRPEPPDYPPAHQQAEREMPPEQVEQMATWERELTDYAHRSDSSGRAARFGLEVLETLRRSRMASMVTVIAYRKSIEKRLELERERDALREALEGAARLLACASCGERPDSPAWKWAHGKGYEEGHVINGPLPDLCGPVRAALTTAPARDGGE